MLTYLMRRATMAAVVMVIVSVICFVLSNVASDPAVGIAGAQATDADLAVVRQTYGLDRPLPVRYAEYIGNLLQGDFGTSYLAKRPVLEMILERLPVTALLAFLSMALALAIALPLGCAAALWPNTLVDRLSQVLAVTGQAIPNFWAGLLLIVVFGVQLRWLPISGSDTLAHFVLPAITLGTFAMPPLMRLIRAGMIEVLASDYIRTARAMGIRPFALTFKYALKNAVLPVISLAAVQLGFMLGGSIVVESIFALNGVGYLAWQSMSRSDMPVIQAIVLLISMIYIVLTLAADLLNGIMDPRLRGARK
ncbi:ABC transporter permease [Aquamicrobium sp. NLF2-7]|jgi:peptide/nickel transport system permease protein|uniref:Peptide/nickel transport system permease protein n=1 Tax=Aquamicrobium lusatiense TaxID=89772 RepID=A0A7W9S4Z7_9HYPH|nr:MULTISPECIES: ABC transporter permease [Aquamicrobium]MBB6013930.1 peptide/nickel transport system permease protein [Aquamicrobium lusatiense]MCG8273531.1 ABC transporter permease [Aquamicrobium sp. NLF2-7]